jgi:thymidylate synthase
MDNYILSEYDSALAAILESGITISGDRTGVGTRCKFGLSTSYDISTRVPILTKRKMVWKSFVKELLWYISGSSNINDLERMGSNIWTPWKNAEFTTKNHFPDGSGGYIYGANLIHYGAALDDPNLDAGFNQLNYVIDTLRNNPASRQALFTFWRPDTNNRAILPACHAMYHFILIPDEQGQLTRLDCHLFQRSCDYPIGGPANLFIASMFVYMIAQQLRVSPNRLYHYASHAHVYTNAIEASTEYLARSESPDSPILLLNYKPSMYDYTVDDFDIVDYNPLPPIKFPIAV